MAALPLRWQQNDRFALPKGQDAVVPVGYVSFEHNRIVGEVRTFLPIMKATVAVDSIFRHCCGMFSKHSDALAKWVQSVFSTQLTMPRNSNSHGQVEVCPRHLDKAWSSAWCKMHSVMSFDPSVYARGLGIRKRKFMVVGHVKQNYLFFVDVSRDVSSLVRQFMIFYLSK